MVCIEKQIDLFKILYIKLLVHNDYSKGEEIKILCFKSF